MSPSDRRSQPEVIDAGFARWLVIVNGLVPVMMLLVAAARDQLGINGASYAIHTTGLVGLILILLSLAMTPIKRHTGWNLLIAIRRPLGVLGFTYIATHFAIYFWFDQAHDIGNTAREITSRNYLLIGIIGLFAMIPLAITSTDGWVTRLGAKKWKLLHRLAYVAGICAVVHFYLQVKSDVTRPQIATGFLVVALGWRIGAHYVDLRKAAKKKPVTKVVDPAKARKFWRGKLKIARIFSETPDVKTFRFTNPDGGKLPFDWKPGQYLSLALTIDGMRVNRSYTIASSPTRGDYCELSVKRAPKGFASWHLHDTWVEGALVDVSAPGGKFFFDDKLATRAMLIGGGVGITPMMSVVRYLTDRCFAGPIRLVFAVRAEQDVVYREELAYLQARFPNLHVTVVLSMPDDGWTGERGYVSPELLARVAPDLADGPIMMCGPEPMMAAVRKVVVGMGIPDAQLHEEAFVSPPASATPERAAASQAMAAVSEVAIDETIALGDGETGEAEVTFARSSKRGALTPDLTVLEVAEEAGVEIPFECRSGICGQCKTRLVTGQVTMDVQDALTPSDRAKGLILACQARASGPICVDA